MTGKGFYVKFAPPVEGHEDRNNIANFINTACHGFITAHMFYGGDIFIKTVGDLNGLHIKKQFNECFDSRASMVHAVGLDYSGMPPKVRNFFVADNEKRPALALLSAPTPKPDPFAEFVGIDTELNLLRNVVATEISRRRKNRNVGTRIREGFLNVLLVGTVGLGKTTLAQAIAQYYKDQGIVDQNAKITFVAGSNPVDMWIGHSENGMRKLLKENENGIIVMDELDAFLKSSSFGSAVLTTLNTEMTANKNRPIIIANCYGSTYNSLISAKSGGNEGLAGRFPATYHLQSYNDQTLIQIFKSKVQAANLFYQDGIETELETLFRNLRRSKGDAFANGREVDNVIDATLQQHNIRTEEASEEILAHAGNGGKITDAQRREYLTLRVEDIPDFDGARRCFVPRAPARTAEISARAARGGAEVVQLDTAPRPQR